MTATISTDNVAGRAARTIAALVCSASIAAGCAGTEARQSTGEFVDDTVVSTKIKTALIRNADVEALDIKVKTFKGVVRLSGFADTDQERHQAEMIAGGIAGVKGVRNEIRVK